MRQTILHTNTVHWNGQGVKTGIVTSRFNEHLTTRLLDTCTTELRVCGIREEDITACYVPGALEIPYALQLMAKSGKYHVLIAIGAIIRGETYHFELVANESAAGISRVSLKYTLPIVNTILTTESEAQAQERIEEKGRAAAYAAIEMALLAQDVRLKA